MIKAEATTKDLERALTDAARRQIPFAMARALTQTVRALPEIEIAQMRKDLDRPTPFTLRGLYTRTASRSNQVAEIGMKRIQDQYLRRQVEGGTRRPDRRALLIPVGQRVNQYGNLPRRTVARLLARKDTFSGRVKGVAGIWQRPKNWRGSPKLLIRYADRAEYQPRFEFQPAALEYVRRNFPGTLAASLRQALETAR